MDGDFMWLDKLKAMKEESGLTTKEIALRANLPEPTLEKLFAGATKDPKLTTLQKLVHFFGHTLDDLDDTTKPLKKAPPELSDEAQKIAKSYEKLTVHGKGAVKAILKYEEKALSRYSQQEDEDSNIITMPKSRRNGPMVQIKVYTQPAAAGLGNYLDEPDFHVEQYPPDIIPLKTDFGIIISGDSMEPKVHDGGTVFVQSTLSIESGKIGIFILNGKSYCKKLVIDRDNQQVRLVSINRKYDDIVVTEFDNLRTVGRVLGQWTQGYKQDVFGW